MSHISRVCTSTPNNKFSIKEIPEVAAKWLGNDSSLMQKFKRIASNSGVENRSLVLPYDEILKLRGLGDRSKIFEEHGLELLKAAINKCLKSEALSKNDISHIIFTSCSVPIIPSIDAKAVIETGLPDTIRRIPVFQHGCVGGVVGLSLGSELSKLGKSVLVCSLELCTLVFQFNDTAGSQLVGASIFADGSAAALIKPGEGKINFVDFMSYLVPESREMMGYDILDDGFHLRLDKELPSILIKYAPNVIAEFLGRNNLEINQVDYFLFHPGGKKILDFFEDRFNLNINQYKWARDVLRENGNMSSATIFFVMERFLNETDLKPGNNILIMGIGPGLTLELILLKS